MYKNKFKSQRKKMQKMNIKKFLYKGKDLKNLN